MPGERVIMIGASAARLRHDGRCDALCVPARRFARLLARSRGSDPDRIPAAPLAVALRNPRVLTFVGVWFGLNLLFGLGSLSIAGFDNNIAWEAHVGGFLAGLLLFSLFDPVAPQSNEQAVRY